MIKKFLITHLVKVLESIGFLMKKMSIKIQIISITHLAQVASKGNYHFKVIKTNDNGNSRTNIIKLSKSDRIAEIASMISWCSCIPISS